MKTTILSILLALAAFSAGCATYPYDGPASTAYKSAGPMGHENRTQPVGG